MNDTLKKRLRLSYRKWERTCDHCGRAKKERAMKDFAKACGEAVAYANTLAIPKEYGELRLATVYFPRNIASWSKGSGGEGILQGDTWDGGPVSWYWLLPLTQPRKDSDIHWHSKPGDALIDLVEHMEKVFGFALTVPPPDPTAEFTTLGQVVDHLFTKGVANKIRGSLFDQLFQFHNNLGRNIRNDYKLWERPHLVRACCEGRTQVHPDEASVAIIEALWQKLNPGQAPPRPPWKWWLGDAEHWVAFPDKVLEVGTLPDLHLQNILRYLTRWTHEHIHNFSHLWMAHGGYFSSAVNNLGDSAQDALCMEVDYLADQTDREWMVRILPALPRLEAEARRRGFEVPEIPSRAVPEGSVVAGGPTP